MKISIIIPTYNSEKYLEETLLSIINQGYKNYEIIVIDGGSTDNTISIIQRYNSLINYFISEKDNGQSNAINKGIRRVTGDIWAWQNSDDLYCKNCFEIVAQHFAAQNIGMLYGDVNYIDQFGMVLYHRKAWKYNFDKFRRGRFIPTQPTVFFSKEVIDHIGYLDESLNYVMDYDYFVRIGEKYDIIKVDDTLGEFRVHSSGKTSNVENYKKVRSEHYSVTKKYKNNSISDRFFIPFYRMYWSLAYNIKYKRKFNVD